MHRLMQGCVDRGEIAGAVTLLAREGRVVDVWTGGARDREARVPMTRDSLFKLASMTKIVTAVAVLQLWEQGRIGLDDPIERYLPEFRNFRVGVGESSVPARAITIRHLLTHTSGLAAAGPDAAALQPAYARVMDRTAYPSMREYLKTVATLPLCNQPGDAMYYGFSYEVLAGLVEIVSGKPFDRYVHDEICAPLGLQDTFYQIPANKQPRLARTYVRGDDNLLTVEPIKLNAYVFGGAGFARGSGGIVSTADDFARFLQALLDGGTLDGARILKKETVVRMTSDQLTGLVTTQHTFLAAHETYGFGVGIRLAGVPAPVPGTPGQYGWSGAYTTWCSVDPARKTVAILLTQHLPWNDRGLFEKFATAAYECIGPPPAH